MIDILFNVWLNDKPNLIAAFSYLVLVVLPLYALIEGRK